MTGAGSAPEWGGTPMEEVGIWAMLQPEHAGQPDIPLLKEFRPRPVPHDHAENSRTAER